MTADDLARLTLELCRVPSETGNERQIADRVETRCRVAAGATATRRVGDSVICDPAPTATGPTIALVGHLDTVRCAAEQEYAIREGRVYGCGASDMKGGVAVMLALLERWRQVGGKRPVWIFYDGEEGAYVENGLEEVFASGVLPPIDYAFILEPTDGGVQVGCQGTLHATVTVRGRRAHSARPWQGENALSRAAPLLERLAAFGRREHRIGELVFYEVLNATQAATENSPNVIPDLVRLNVNHRFPPGMTVETALATVREAVGEEAEVELRDASPPGDVCHDHPLVAGWLRNEGLAVEAKQAWTDVARFTGRGIPAINFGPGETAQAHQANEWCPVASLAATYGALERYLSASYPA